MTRRSIDALVALALLTAVTPVGAVTPDARLREIVYDPRVVVTLPVKRGVVTLIVLDPDEAIVELASGLSADCGKPDASWCVAAQAGGRTIFVKPKLAADDPDTLAVVTDRRIHSFRLVVVDDRDRIEPVYRLLVKAPPTAPVLRPAARRDVHADAASDLSPASSAALVASRLQGMPEVANSAYSLAEGIASADIVPTLVFDDGRFTYLGFAANRELPAVFQVLGNGDETLVNTRMEGELLVVDRVSRHLVLRAGQAVVGLWNDAFDLDGRPPVQGSTAAGVARVRAKGQP